MNAYLHRLQFFSNIILVVKSEPDSNIPLPRQKGLFAVGAGTLFFASNVVAPSYLGRLINLLFLLVA
jgi:hypothetical protein